MASNKKTATDLTSPLLNEHTSKNLICRLPALANWSAPYILRLSDLAVTRVFKLTSLFTYK